MKLSPRGRALLIKEEGSRTKAYKDSKGIWTIGVGHTAAAGPPVPKAGLVISPEEVDALLSKDVVVYEDIVNRHITVPLNQNEFDALVLLVFNIGEKQFSTSSVKRLLNQGKRKEAAEAFLLWKRAGDDPDILLARRQREKALFLTKVDTNAPHSVSTNTNPHGADRTVPERTEAAGDHNQAPGNGAPTSPGTAGGEQSGSTECFLVRLGLAALRWLGVWLRSRV